MLKNKFRNTLKNSRKFQMFQSEIFHRASVPTTQSSILD